MDSLGIVLRFVHIGPAVAWAGAAFFVLAVLDPMARRIGTADSNLLQRHLQVRSVLAVYFPVVAVLTVVGGIAMYVHIDGAKAYPMDHASGIVFTIGAAAGVLALVWGASMEGRLNTKIKRLAKSMEPKATPQQERELAELGLRLANATRVSGPLILVAVFAMATFRYFG